MSNRTAASPGAGSWPAPTPGRSTRRSRPSWRASARSSPPGWGSRTPMASDVFARPVISRIARRGQDADLALRRGRVRDLIGLIIEATGLRVEMGEVGLGADGRDRGGAGQVPTEVVGFRGGRTLLMP